MKKLIILTIVLFPAILPAKEIAVILREGIRPYQEVLKGFESNINHLVSKYYFSDNTSKNDRIIKRLESKRPDLILTIGESSLKFANKNFKDIPIIYTMVFNPFPIVDKHNITGICMEVDTKSKFKMLKTIMPQAKKIGVVYNHPVTGRLIKKAKADARELGMELVALSVTSSEALSAINSLEDKVDALWMILDSTILTQQVIEHMLLWSFRNKIPLIGLSEKYVELGALFSLSFQLKDMGKQASELSKEILKGKKDSLPSFICAYNWKLCLNKKIADKIGIKIPEEIKRQASMIYD